MESYPVWAQVLAFTLIANAIPFVGVFYILGIKKIPYVIKYLIFFIGLFLVDKIHDFMPVAKEAKVISNWGSGICILIFLIWAIKTRWLDKEPAKDASEAGENQEEKAGE